VVRSLGKNMSATKQNIEAALDASKEVGLEVEKTKYMFMSRHQT
jgi:hypothetical protein